MMYASDDDWNEFLLMLEVHKQKMVDASALGIKK
jgi:hypothetical protein